MAIDAHQPSWVRRGHNRQPNRVVCGLYEFFDLIGDFGPMFASFFRWIGRTAMRIWDFLIRTSMIIINIGLLVGIIYLSVGHSYDLLIFAGFSGIAAWVAVAVWEAVFVYCSIVIQNAYRHGKKSSKAAWIGFLMGFAFVEVSNYMGMSENIIGKAIGIATPVLLLVMKKVLAYQFRKDVPKKKKFWLVSVLVSFFTWIGQLFHVVKKRKEIIQEVDMDIEMNKQDTHTQEGNHSHNIVSHTTLSQHTANHVSPHTHTETKNASQLTHTNESVRRSLTEENVSQSSQDVLTVSQQKGDHDFSQMDETHTDLGKEKVSQEEKAHSEEPLSRAGLGVGEFSQTGDSHNENRDQNLSQTATVSQEGILTTEEETSSHNDSHTQSHNSHTTDSHTQTESHTSQKGSHTHAESHTQKSSHKKIHTLTQKESHTSSQDENEKELLTDLEEIKKKALKYAENNGEYPSIRVLAKEAPCSEWNARKALNELNPQQKKKKAKTG